MVDKWYFIFEGMFRSFPELCLSIKNWTYFDRFMVIPDMLKNAPMFKRLDAKIKVLIYLFSYIMQLFEDF